MLRWIVRSFWEAFFPFKVIWNTWNQSTKNPARNNINLASLAVFHQPTHEWKNIRISSNWIMKPQFAGWTYHNIWNHHLRSYCGKCFLFNWEMPPVFLRLPQFSTFLFRSKCPGFQSTTLKVFWGFDIPSNPSERPLKGKISRGGSDGCVSFSSEIPHNTPLKTENMRSSM